MAIVEERCYGGCKIFVDDEAYRNQSPADIEEHIRSVYEMEARLSAKDNLVEGSLAEGEVLGEQFSNTL